MDNSIQNNIFQQQTWTEKNGYFYLSWKDYDGKWRARLLVICMRINMQ